MAADQQATIAYGAELCLRSFQECLQQSASIHPREISLVEDQLARFSVWSASIGVFAPGRASMDHRLREAPEIQEVVRGLLDGLNDDIQNCLSVLKVIVELLSKNPKGVLVAVDENLNVSLRAIANEISLLHRLSNTIRRASKESQNLKAAKAFQIKDDDGNDAETLLQGVFAHYILGRFPNIDDTLRQRLAFTMLLRRKRILYRRSRYGKNPIRPKKNVLKPLLEAPLVQQTTDGPDQPQSRDSDQVIAKPTQSIVNSMAVSATTLAAENFRKASSPSVVSQMKTVALGSHEDLILPPAPTGRLKQKYRQLKTLREEEHKARLESLPGYLANYRKQGNRERFLKSLTDFMQQQSLSRTTGLIGEDLNAYLYALYFTVAQFGGHKQVLGESDGWSQVAHAMQLDPLRITAAPQQLEAYYESYLAQYEEAVRRKISDAEATLERTLEKDWTYCSQVIAEVTCPFCFYALPSLEVIDEKKWKAHVKNDLDAYICLFEECDKPEELYNHSEAWLKHMREHALRWRCNSRSHGELIFDTEAKYLDHMRTKHSALSEAQLRVLAERSAQMIGPLFESCPFCGTNEAKGRLEDHIVGHLRSLALKSFPTYQDEGSEDSRSVQGSLGTSEPRSRSTIKMDPERYTKPIFVDVSEQSSFKNGSSSGNVNAASPYSSWGGFRGYISQYPEGLKETAELGPQIAEMESLGFEQSKIEIAMLAANYDPKRTMEYLLGAREIVYAGPQGMASSSVDVLHDAARSSKTPRWMPTWMPTWMSSKDHLRKSEIDTGHGTEKETMNLLSPARDNIEEVRKNSTIQSDEQRPFKTAIPEKLELTWRGNLLESLKRTGAYYGDSKAIPAAPLAILIPICQAIRAANSTAPTDSIADPLFPHLSVDGASLGGPLRPRQRFPLPSIPDNDELQPIQWFKDPSAEFVEDSLFDEAVNVDRRIFEWGFVPETDGSSSLEDPIIQSILTYRLTSPVKASQSEVDALRARGSETSHRSLPNEDRQGSSNISDDSLDSEISLRADRSNYPNERNLAMEPLSHEAGNNDEDLQERTETQGKELIKLTTPTIVDRSYFNQLQSNQPTGTEPIPTHKLSRTNRDAFINGYCKRFFVEEKELGRGGKGVVLLLRHEIDGVDLGQYACKRIPIGDDVAWLEKVLTEVQLLQSLSHPNLVAYRHIWLEDVTISRFGPPVPCAFILQDYCNSGDLLHYIIGSEPSPKEQPKKHMRRRARGLLDKKIDRKAYFRKLSFEEIYSFSKDMTSGLAYLHSSHYIHRDLKPSNVLLHKDGNEFRCLLSDFGEIQAENAIRHPNDAMFPGTLSYCAPELLRQDDSGRYGTYTTKSDMFSLGMIIYFMCCGTLPYIAANKEEGDFDVDVLREEILSWPGLQDGAAERNARPDLPRQFIALLGVLLAIDPTDRPSAKEALDVFVKA